MKILKTNGATTRYNFSLKKIREWEKQLGVYLDAPRTPLPLAAEQYAVYDKNGVYAGDIHSRSNCFSSVDEVKGAILTLDVWEQPPRDDSHFWKDG